LDYAACAPHGELGTICAFGDIEIVGWSLDGLDGLKWQSLTELTAEVF